MSWYVIWVFVIEEKQAVSIHKIKIEKYKEEEKRKSLDQVLCLIQFLWRVEIDN